MPQICAESRTHSSLQVGIHGRFLLAFVLLTLLLLPASPAFSACDDEFIWDGSAGDWSDQSRWLLGGLNNMGVPGAGDCAFIGSGSVDLDSAVTVLTLRLGGGQLAGPFDIGATTFEWTGGLIAGDDSAMDSLLVSAGCSFSNASQKQVSGRTLECGGTSTVTDSGPIIIGSFFADAVIFVPDGAVMEISGTQTFTGQGGSVTGTFLNHGLVSRPLPESSAQGGGITTFTALLFDNEGTVRVEQGEVELPGGTSTGTFEAEVAGERVITFTNGIHQLFAGFSFTGAGVSGQSGGTVDVDAPGSAERWRQTGGTLQGEGSFTMDYFEWSGGTLQGPGDKIAAVNLLISGDGPKVAAGAFTVENQGNGAWQGSGTVSFDQATFRNAPGAVFQLENAAVFGRGAGQGFFDQRGLLRKTSAGTSAFELDFTSSGDVEIDAGTLELRAPGTGAYVQTDGSTVVAAGRQLLATTVQLSGGVLWVDGELSRSSGSLAQLDVSGGVLTGGGTVRASSLFTSAAGILGGGLTIDGNVFNGGSLEPGEPPLKTLDVLQVVGGLTLESGGLFSVELGGTVAGSGYDQVASEMTAALGGTLEVRRLPGFLPQVGESFTVLDAPTTGSFDLSILPPGYQWQVDLNPVVLTVTDSFLIFADGFESGDTTSWSATTSP